MTLGRFSNSSGVDQTDLRWVASKKNLLQSLVKTMDQGVPGIGTLSIGRVTFFSPALVGLIDTAAGKVGGAGGPVPSLAATRARSSLLLASISSGSLDSVKGAVTRGLGLPIKGLKEGS